MQFYEKNVLNAICKCITAKSYTIKKRFARLLSSWCPFYQFHITSNSFKPL